MISVLGNREELFVLKEIREFSNRSEGVFLKVFLFF